MPDVQTRLIVAAGTVSNSGHQCPYASHIHDINRLETTSVPDIVYYHWIDAGPFDSLFDCSAGNHCRTKVQERSPEGANCRGASRYDYSWIRLDDGEICRFSLTHFGKRSLSCSQSTLAE